MHEWGIPIGGLCSLQILGTGYRSTVTKSSCTNLFFHRSNVLRALNLCLCGDQAETANRNPHVMSPALWHSKIEWQVGGALQREKRENHCKYCVLVTVLAELENRPLHLQLIRLTQLRLQMESLCSGNNQRWLDMCCNLAFKYNHMYNIFCFLLAIGLENY